MKPCLLIISLIWSIQARTQNPSCAWLAARGNAHVVRFLQEQNPNRNSLCIASAIKKLGQSHDASAVRILIKYLDYLDPTTAPNPTGGADLRPDYPAVTALFQIGKPGTPELVEAIESGTTIRKNAEKAFLFIYRDDLASGIHLLSHKLAGTSETVRRNNLSEALRLLTKACTEIGGAEAAECANVSSR